MMSPFQGFPPELLAKIAQGAFRPPQAMMGGGGGVPGMQMPQQGGDGLGAGMAGLGMGLGNWKPKDTIMNAGPQGAGPGGAYTQAQAMDMAGMGNGMMLSPMNPSYGDLGGPGQGGGLMQRLGLI